MATHRRGRPTGRGEGLSGKRKAAIFGVVALVAGGACVALVGQMIQAFERQIEEAGRAPVRVPVVMASHDLFPGMPITAADLRVEEVPVEFLPGGTEELVFGAAQQVVGRAPRERILSGEYLRDDRLADAAQGTGLNGLIAPGYRALAIGVGNASAVAGFLRPGNVVDVLLSHRLDGEDSPPSETRIIAQAVTVLAVNDLSAETAPSGEGARALPQRQRSSAPSVTLHLSPEQAAMVVLAEHLGSLHLSMRSQGDVDAAAVSPVSSLYKWPVHEQPTSTPSTPPTTASPAEPARPTLTEIRGTDVIVTTPPPGWE